MPTPIEDLIVKCQENYDKIADGTRSIQKGKALNEAANVIIRLTLLQLTKAAVKFPTTNPKLLATNDTELYEIEGALSQEPEE